MAKKEKIPINLILKAVALAMGVSSIVLLILGSTQTTVILMPIAVTCLALVELNKEK